MILNIHYFADDNNKEEWAKGIKPSEFRLLCSQGGSSEVTKYKDCNLERVPAHKVKKTLVNCI